MVPSPVDLAPGQSGCFFLIHETRLAGDSVDVVSLRSANLTGRPAERVVLDRPLRVHKLIRVRPEELELFRMRQTLDGRRGLVVMSDDPSELRWMTDMIEGARGRVLVGGFGLGLVVRFLEDRPEVDSIHVVEREADVLRLCCDPLEWSPKVRVFHSDFEAFLDERPWQYDVAILDLWAGTTESVWEEEVAPRRLAIARRFGARDVRCWAEPEMIGQLRRSLAAHAGRRLDAVRFSRAQWTFRAGTVDLYQPDAPARRVDPAAGILARLADPGFDLLVHLFLRDVGSPAWERRFGRAWDDWAPVVA